MKRRRSKHNFVASRPVRKKIGRHRHTARPELEQEILAALHKGKTPLTLQDLLSCLNWPSTGNKDLISLLTDLCGQGVITCVRNKKSEKRYSLPAPEDLIEGTIEMNPRGFGFAVISEHEKIAKELAQNDKKDLFLAPDNLGTAKHGDKVLLRVIRRRGRPEARVVQVVKRSASRLVGRYVAGATGLVIPEDNRLLFNVLVKKEHSCGARNDNAVVVEITDYKLGHRNPQGKIIEVLGDPDDIGVRNEMVIRKFKLPHEFSEACLQEAAELPEQIAQDESRRDLRDIRHVTIDGEDARDFDDAVSVIKTDKGFRLYISIADVSHYVRPGSFLDQDAYQRGTSVYFPTRVVPMLPERLSNDLCSLVPNKERPAFTAVLDFDESGLRRGQKFFKSLIVSQLRLTYTMVAEILESRKPIAEIQPKELKAMVPSLLEMGQLAKLLEKRRMARGSIGFELPEAKLVLGEHGEITDVARLERNQAHKLIEEFMLAANEAVAETLARAECPTLYRIHEEPAPARIEEFVEFARTLGLTLPKNTGGPAWFGKILLLAAGTPKEYIVNNLLLRAMQRARYSPDNVGHFGLSASHYTHFTSPIRRYPDLMVHRALQGLLSKQHDKNATGKSKPPANLEATGEFLSDRERVATEAEREMVDILKARFMAEKLGENFTGIVAGVTGFGLFVELLDYFVSGAIPVEKLSDDYYQHDDKNHRLIGANSGRIFQIGDLIKITVADVDLQRNRINFVLADDKKKSPLNSGLNIRKDVGRQNKKRNR